MDERYSRYYSASEDSHWWFTARRIILRRLLAREVDWTTGKDVLEVGAGSGANLYALYPPTARVWGLEPDPAAAERARQRGTIPILTGSLEALPPPLDRMAFDVIGLFDVLEHIADDRRALGDLRTRLRPDGHLLLAVPAYQWMWGRQDMVSHHFRRYTRRRLEALLRASGFAVQRATYFNSLLFPFVAAIRLMARVLPRPGGPVRSDLESFRPGLLNTILHRIFAAEAGWLGRFGFPAGVSLFVSARPMPDSQGSARGTGLATPAPMRDSPSRVPDRQ